MTPGNELSVLSTDPVMLRVQEGEVCEDQWQIIEADGIYNSTMKIPGMQPYYAILI